MKTKARTWKRWAIVARPDLGDDLQNDTYPTKAEAVERLSVLNKTHEKYRTSPGPIKSDYGWRLQKVVVTAVAPGKIGHDNGGDTVTIRTFRLKHMPVTAIQYDGTVESAIECGLKGDPAWNRPYVDSKNGRLIFADPGNWIVTEHNGGKDVRSDEEFWAQYEEVES